MPNPCIFGIAWGFLFTIKETRGGVRVEKIARLNPPPCLVVRPCVGPRGSGLSGAHPAVGTRIRVFLMTRA